MEQLRRIIVESESTETLNNAASNKAATKKKHKHSSKSVIAKRKLRQINYEKAIRAAQSLLESNEFKLAYEMQRRAEAYKRLCKDINNVENFERAQRNHFKGWELHHRLETHTSMGQRRTVDISANELIELDMYYNRPAEEFIFLRSKEHRQLHHLKLN